VACASATAFPKGGNATCKFKRRGPLHAVKPADITQALPGVCGIFFFALCMGSRWNPLETKLSLTDRQHIDDIIGGCGEVVLLGHFVSENVKASGEDDQGGVKAVFQLQRGNRCHFGGIEREAGEPMGDLWTLVSRSDIDPTHSSRTPREQPRFPRFLRPMNPENEARLKLPIIGIGCAGVSCDQRDDWGMRGYVGSKFD
jgi:hypothetical protein